MDNQLERSLFLGRLSKIEKKYKQRKKNFFLKHPFLAIRNSIIGRFIHTISRNKLSIPFYRKTFFNEIMCASIPPYEDILFSGAHLIDSEIRLTKFFIRIISSGETFFDLGANYGYYSLLASHFVGEGGCVFSFDPDSSALKFLKKNKRKNMVIIESAVGNADGTIELYSFSEIDSLVSTTNINNLSQNESVSLDRTTIKKRTVPVLKLDSFCAQWDVCPRVIKIDVEGAESLVLRGFHEGLESKDDIIIAIEVWIDPFTDNYRDAISFMLEHGYRVSTLNDEGKPIECPSIEYLENEYFPWLKKSLSQKGDSSIADNIIFHKNKLIV